MLEPALAKDLDVVEQLPAWDEMLAKGDLSLDRGAITSSRTADPTDEYSLLFHAPQSAAAVQLARTAGVDFAVRRPDGETVLSESDLYEPKIFAIVAQDLSARGAVDWADSEGFTALSVQVKHSQVDNARTLPENGASLNSFARVAHDGGAVSHNCNAGCQHPDRPRGPSGCVDHIAAAIAQI